MVLKRKNLILLITIWSFLYSSISAGSLKSHHTYKHLRDHSRSNIKCDENELFPEAPCCGVNKLSDRIHGGVNAEVIEFPWMVHVCIDHISVCGGASLINSRWVLTAGHNVAGHSVIEVHIGKWNTTPPHSCTGEFCDPTHKEVYADKVILHELYNMDHGVAVHDVALLHLDETISYNEYILPICLPLHTSEHERFANKMAVVIGWGLTENETLSEILSKASVKVWDPKNCHEHAFNASNQICAGGEEGIDSCTGDSGGPLMLRLAKDMHQFYLQIGLVSYGGECGEYGSPGIYASIPAYMKWIKETILRFQ